MLRKYLKLCHFRKSVLVRCDTATNTETNTKWRQIRPASSFWHQRIPRGTRHFGGPCIVAVAAAYLTL